jgi:hypothetical protein
VYCAAYAGGWLESCEQVAQNVLADEDTHVEHRRLRGGVLSPACQKKRCTCASEQLGDARVRVGALALEAAAPPELQLILARVALGVTKDFGGRCLSFRSVGGEPITFDEWPSNRDRLRLLPPERPLEQPGAAGHTNTGSRTIQLYDSVTCAPISAQWFRMYFSMRLC